MANKSSPFFEVSLGPAGLLRFANADSLVAWIKKEKEFFKFLRLDENPGRNGSPYSDVQQQLRVLDVAQSYAEQAIGSLGKPELQRNHLNALREHLIANFTGRHPALLSKDPRAHFVQVLWFEGQKAAAFWAMLAFQNRLSNLNEPPQFDGAFRAKAFELELKDSARSEMAALEQLRAIYQGQLQELDTARHNLARAIEDAEEAATKSAHDREVAFKEAQEARSEVFEKSKESWAGDLEQLTKTYNDHMALQAPSLYWEQKARRHAHFAGWFSAATGVFIAAYIGLASWVVPRYIGKLKGVVDGETAPSTTTTTTAAPLSDSVPVYLVIFVTALIGIWILRILIRLVLSHIHRGGDAKHRSVSIKAYLALLRNKNKPIGDAEREIIITQLFRPASDGLVKDDAMPPTLIERITAR